MGPKPSEKLGGPEADLTAGQIAEAALGKPCQRRGY